METFIYSLDCPITGTPKYIGKTINIKQRLAQHIRSNENTKKYAWIKSLKSNNLKPTITIIDSFSVDYDFWENWYIDYYRFLGFDLKNHKGGGIGGKLSVETRKKISEKLKGKKKSLEHRAKCIINLNKPGCSPWNKGIKLNEENKTKAIMALENYRKNNVNCNLGKKRSQETIQKIKLTFEQKYGWKRKPNKFKSFNDYNKSRQRFVIRIDDLGNELETLSLVDCKKMGYITQNIINCINGKRKKANGFYWKYSK